jgi:hypothetical protein
MHATLLNSTTLVCHVPPFAEPAPSSFTLQVQIAHANVLAAPLSIGQQASDCGLWRSRKTFMIKQ